MGVSAALLTTEVNCSVQEKIKGTCFESPALHGIPGPPRAHQQESLLNMGNHWTSPPRSQRENFKIKPQVNCFRAEKSGPCVQTIPSTFCISSALQLF